jgi:tetraacyldisaccharide 4'-kinase
MSAVMSIENFVTEIIEGRRTSFWIKGGLFFLSIFFAAGSFIRHFFYNIGFFSQHKVPCYVVSIGNIVAGGTGKTPFVAMLANKVVSKRVAIVSRGYRSKGKGSRLVSQGKGPIVSAEVAGDEAYLLAKQVKADVWVGKNRLESCQKAIEKGAKIILLEDGFQHRKVKRNVEIVLMHAADLWGRGHFLPRGYLRESPKRLKSADWIVVTYVDDSHDKEAIIKQIRKVSSAPVIGFRVSYGEEDRKRIAGNKVGVFCGIAKPLVFSQAIENLGAEIIGTLIVEDHKRAPVETLISFAEECAKNGAKLLICTEKDWVKLSSHERLALPICVLCMQFKCVWNENLWHKLCQTMEKV